MSPEQRDQIAADASTRYELGETWRQIGASYGISGAHVRRLTTARHDITYHRWGRRPVADPQEVSWRRDEGQTLDEIAAALDCSRQAVRTALEAGGKEVGHSLSAPVPAARPHSRRARTHQCAVRGVSGRASQPARRPRHARS